jgi:hypothetical protein
MNRGLLTPNQHGATEPFLAALVGASPWIFGFSSVVPARNVAVLAAALIVVAGLCTSWKPAFFHLIPLRAHLAIDVALGLILVISPLLLGFTGELTASITLALLGAAVLATAGLTRWGEVPFDYPERGPSTVEDGSTLSWSVRRKAGRPPATGVGDTIPDDPESLREWPDPARPDRARQENRGSA